jgi:hypothetical protein
MLGDRDFRHYPHGRDSDYRSRDYTEDSRLEYTEDQDYRAHERGDAIAGGKNGGAAVPRRPTKNPDKIGTGTITAKTMTVTK